MSIAHTLVHAFLDTFVNEFIHAFAADCTHRCERKAGLVRVLRRVASQACRNNSVRGFTFSPQCHAQSLR